MSTIQYVDLGSQVYQRLKEMILSNQLLPGEKIPQEKIAAELGVSRTPLLKALQILEQEYLVENIPRRGMYVKAMSLKEILDAFECRVGLEGVATRLATKYATDAEINQLENIFLPFKTDPGAINWKKYVTADQKFHRLLIRISGNHILRRIEMLGNIHIISYQRGLVREPVDTLNEHLGIVEAIQKRDCDLAEERMHNHLRISCDQIADAVEAEKN